MTVGTQDEGEARMSVSACFALSQGIAPQVEMKWTGHSDYMAMNLFEKGLKKWANSVNLIIFQELTP